MNEYFVEDEYSFYEIDPECKIGISKEENRAYKFRGAQKGEEAILMTDGSGEEVILMTDGSGEEVILMTDGSGQEAILMTDGNEEEKKCCIKNRKSNRCGCSWLILYYLLFSGTICSGLEKMPDRRR